MADPRALVAADRGRPRSGARGNAFRTPPGRLDVALEMRGVPARSGLRNVHVRGGGPRVHQALPTWIHLDPAGHGGPDRREGATKLWLRLTRLGWAKSPPTISSLAG